jgi:hypothetical protein
MTREDIIRWAREVEDYADTIYEKGEYHPGWLEVRDQRFAALVATAEKQKVVEYMNSRAFATGHGDTIEDLLKEMEWQVAEREREACAKLCDGWTHADGDRCAAAIRARGSK